MNTEEEARKRLIEASKEKQLEHVRKIYEEAGSEPALSDFSRQLEQDGHFLPVSGTRSPDEDAASFWDSISQQKLPDSGGDSLFSTGPSGQLKSKKKRSKKKGLTKRSYKKRRLSKRRTKKKRSKKRRQRKYIQKGGDSLEIWVPGSPGQWETGDITYNADNSITVGGNQINFGGEITELTIGGLTRYQITQPNDTIITIKLNDPNDINELKRIIAYHLTPEEFIPYNKRRVG